ncbi:dehydrogenase/reductase SDR family member 4-like [Clavelina lepadiformis]|uniref:dehydrogenase/reductase SDR family member 4-like n=1 Tax=Clavelina lepadiformis TaxID=159417 RepID=UPI0040429A2B
MAKHSGKVAVITASTEGIGFAIARKLGLDGAHVVISSRKQANVDQAINALKAENISVSGVACHVGKASDRRALLDKVEKDHGGIDILVLNAGVNPYFGSILGTPESAYDKILDINVKSTFMFIQESVPMIEKRGKGSIVIVTSVGGYVPSELLGIYGVSKTALLGLVKALVPELCSKNIRVNGLAPGLIKTKMSGALLSQGEEVAAQMIPINKVGRPDDCAGIVSFLSSDEAAYITGETVVVAGGVQSRL